jgi:TPR repeat protein
VTPPVLHIVDCAERAADSIARMARLATMSSSQLANLLGGEAGQAASWVEAAAIHGIVPAQLMWGRMLLEGQGVARDRAAALRWFRRAAQTGDGDAMNMVGRCFEQGWGCIADPALAALWYRRSAEAGHDWGQYNLANLLFDGRGEAQDMVAAVTLYHSAARQGHARAMNLLGRCCQEGWGAPVDAAAAAYWYRKSAEAGYFRGQFNHAVELLQQGRTKEAEFWLKRALDDADDGLRERITGILPSLRFPQADHRPEEPQRRSGNKYAASWIAAAQEGVAG